MSRASKIELSVFDQVCSAITFSGGIFLATMAVVSWYFSA